MSKIIIGNPQLTTNKSNHVNRILNNDDDDICHHETVVNSVAEDCAKDSLQNREQQQTGQLHEVITKLENWKCEDLGERVSSGKSFPSSRAEGVPKAMLYDWSHSDGDTEEYYTANVATNKEKADDSVDGKNDRDAVNDSCGVGDTTTCSVNTPRAKLEVPNAKSSSTCFQSIGNLPIECRVSQDAHVSNPHSNFVDSDRLHEHYRREETYISPSAEATMVQVGLEREQTSRMCNYSYPSNDIQSHTSSTYSRSAYPPSFGNTQYPLPGLNAADEGGESGYRDETSLEIVYPSIYVSTCGLITVLLRKEASVELTVDRTIRIVSHTSKMAVASSARGNLAVLFHPDVNVSQDRDIANVQINGVKVRMLPGEVWVGNDCAAFRFDEDVINPTRPIFRDMSKDESVNLILSADTYGEKFVSHCLDLASRAEYENLSNGGIQIRINGIKINQNDRGDVVVVTGPKFLKMSPSGGLVRINTQYVEVAVENDLSTMVRIGPHILSATDGRVTVSNGRIEAGFDEHSRLKVWSLPERVPLEVGVRRNRKQYGLQRRRATALGGAY